MRELLITIVASVLVIAGGGYVVYTRETVRPGPGIVANAERKLRLVTAELERVRQQPPLGVLDQAWMDVQFVLEACGVAITPVSPDSGGGEGDILFAGPVPAWHATATGPTQSVLTCLDLANAEHSLYLGRISLMADEASITYSVLGRVGQ